MNNIEWHYNNYKVQYHIISFLKNREFCILPSKVKNTKIKPTRNLRVHSIQHLQFMLKRFSLFRDLNHLANFYYSVAEFDGGLPFQNLGDLSNEGRELTDWNKNCHKKIIAYDFCIDIDAGSFDDFKHAEISARILKKLFDETEFPYELRFSGMGFHFVTPYKYFPSTYHFNPHEDGNIYQFFRSIAQKLSEEYSEMIDLNIYDHRRVLKIPFSLAIYDEKVLVCEPVNDLSNFEVNQAERFDGVFHGKLYNSEGNVYKLLERLGLNGTQKPTRKESKQKILSK